MRILAIVTIAALLAAAGCLTGYTTAEIPREEHFNYTVLFCGDSQDNCMEKLLQLINYSKEIKCALYNLDSSVANALERKNAEVVVDDSAKTATATAIKRNTTGLMHNKFCVFDKRIVWTGSYNPVKRNSHDDVIIINSTALAKNYLEEFDELKSDGSSVATATTDIILNNTLIENHFCPEDSCIEKLQQQLEKANGSIYFATYSFTHPKIANELIIKHSSGVFVRGIIESSGDYSQLEALQLNNISATKDKSKALMHHKFFIIDNSTVITGSFNPTRNADTRNDENMLIVHNNEVAGKYLDYFGRLT